MMISVVVMTPDRAVSAYLGTKKHGLIAPDIRNKLRDVGHSASVVSILTNSVEDAHDYFSRIYHDVEAIILLCDERLADLTRPFRSAFFVRMYDCGMGGTNPQNYFQKVCAKTLRSFITFLSKFEEEKYRRLLLLPLRNFIGHELDDIYHLFSDGVDPATFGPRLEAALAALRLRQRPKTSANYPHTYVVDDEQRYFVYGKERHARVETKCPPHKRECLISAHFRFGRRYDADRHFNVSVEGDQISGVFTDCHGCRSMLPPASHVNLFPNDFFA